jgi:hypothetical protein
MSFGTHHRREWVPSRVWLQSRGFFEDRVSSYEEFEIEADGYPTSATESHSRSSLSGAVVGGRGEVRVRFATVGVWTEGLVVRVTNYPDIDEARAAAERLAASRG